MIAKSTKMLKIVSSYFSYFGAISAELECFYLVGSLSFPSFPLSLGGFSGVLSVEKKIQKTKMTCRDRMHLWASHPYSTLLTLQFLPKTFWFGEYVEIQIIYWLKKFAINKRHVNLLFNNLTYYYYYIFCLFIFVKILYVRKVKKVKKRS